MKRLTKVFTLFLSAITAVCAIFAGCSKKVVVENDGILKDMDVPPQVSAAYEEYSKKALSDYKAVAQAHLADGEPDASHPQVKRAAADAAAKLYAYACYNERTLDKYVYFGNQEGTTDLGASGFADAVRQEYYLRVNESENTCGYRYHYTIKKVRDAGGLVATAKGLFESARTRITDKTNLLYRLEGSGIEFGANHEALNCSLLTCEWKKGKNWGDPDVEMKKSAFIPPEEIRADIEKYAGEDNITIRGNINILADDIVKNATITELDDGSIFLIIKINTDVANKDEASLKMLRKANGSDNCLWVRDEEDEDDSGLTLVVRLWENGLFRTLTVAERWSGKINGFTGAADSATICYYSYSDRDCDMTDYLKLINAYSEEE